MSETRKTGQLIAGLVIVGIGLLIALERTTGFYIDGLYRLWPLIILGIGAVRLIGGADQKARGTGLFMLALGSYFLIASLELFDLDWSNAWPLLLIFMGTARMVLPADDGGRSPGLLLVLIGAWSFLSVHELWGFTWSSSWPLALIAVGIFIIWKALFEGRSSSEEENNDPSS